MSSNQEVKTTMLTKKKNEEIHQLQQHSTEHLIQASLHFLVFRSFKSKCYKYCYERLFFLNSPHT